MNPPRVGKQRSAGKPISLAKAMPRLRLPSAPPVSAARAKPVVGKAAGKPPQGPDVKGRRNG